MMNNIIRIKETLSWWDFYVLDFEILLFLIILTFFICGTFIKNRNVLINYLLYCLSILWLYGLFTLVNPTEMFYGCYFHFSKSLFFQVIKLIILSIFIIITLISKSYLKIKKEIRVFELFLLFLINLLGACLSLSSEDFFILYLSIEIQSLCVYILIPMNLRSLKAREAGIKYFIQSSVISAFFLLGLSFFYGVSGSLNFYNINILYIDIPGEFKEILLLAVICILVLFFFKLGLAPFHMWLPDVYEGTSLLVMFFLITIPKITFMFVLVRCSYYAINCFIIYFTNLFLIIGILSIIIGTFGAIYQIKIKRLIAYSTISHMGFVIIGFSLNNLLGYFAFIFYLFTYIIILIGFFTFLLSVQKSSNFKSLKYIYELKSLKESKSFLSYLIMIILFSNAGVPPFLGFFAKFFIFLALINSKYYFLCFLIIILSIISTVYYLRLIRFLFFEPANLVGNFLPINAINKFVLVFFVYLNFLLCIFPLPLVYGIIKLISLLFN